MYFFNGIRKKWSEMSRLDKTAVTVLLSAAAGNLLSTYKNKISTQQIEEELRAIEAVHGVAQQDKISTHRM